MGKIIFSEQIMNDAIEEYGCNCDDCCTHLLLERYLNRELSEEDRRFIDNSYLFEFHE